MKRATSVVLIGRTNVGKSSLFNRLTETKGALVSRIAGTTRDYNIGQVAWRKKTFELIDSGGVNIDILQNSINSLLDKKNKKVSEIDEQIIEQTKAAIAKADMVLMVVDAKAGVMPEDKQLSLVLKKVGKPVMVLANKVDNQRYRNAISEFYKLGLGEVYPVSASNGSGVGDFLDVLLKEIKWGAGRQANPKQDNSIKVSIIGKPNVGKSSLVNKILGEKRVIVSAEAHTTRDPQNTVLTYKGQDITLIDTAGLRRKAKIEFGLEKISTSKTLKTAKNSDIILLITEVDQPLAKQDEKLANFINDIGAGLIIVANKWDLIEDKHPNLDKKVNNYYQANFPSLAYAPIVFISAKTGRGVDRILDLVLEVAANRKKEIAQEDLDKILNTAVKKHYPAQAWGPNRPHIYGIKQTHVDPPIFTVTVGLQQSLHFSYERFLENQIRQNFDFKGVPVKIVTRNIKR